MMQEMTLGEVVDYVIDYNERNKEEDEEEEKEKPKKSKVLRKATQNDIDAFFG